MWQIPLFNEKILSIGLVSKVEINNKSKFLKLAQENVTSNFQITKCEEAAEPYYNNYHAKNNFAQHAKTASTRDYILIGDAFGFGDPIYSVGTASAARQAREVAMMLNSGKWNEEKVEFYNTLANELLANSLKAFEYWYDNDVLSNDKVSEIVQRDYLHGDLFEVGFRLNYELVLEDVVAEISVKSLEKKLQINNVYAGRQLAAISIKNSDIKLTFNDSRSQFFVVLRQRGSGQPYYKESKEFEISYLGTSLTENDIIFLTTLKDYLDVANLK